MFNSPQGYTPLGNLRDNARLSVAARTFTNLPAADTEVANADRQTLDLSAYSYCSMVAYVQVAGNTGVACIQYSLDNSVWTDLTGTIPLSSTGMKRSVRVPIPAAARTIVVVRMVGRNGDTLEDPALGVGVTLELT